MCVTECVEGDGRGGGVRGGGSKGRVRGEGGGGSKGRGRGASSEGLNKANINDQDSEVERE